MWRSLVMKTCMERMAAIMQHKTANYDGDLMQHLIKLGEEISGKTYDADDYSCLLYTSRCV